MYKDTRTVSKISSDHASDYGNARFTRYFSKFCLIVYKLAIYQFFNLKMIIFNFGFFTKVFWAIIGPHFLSNKGFKGVRIVNRALPSFHGGSLKIKLIQSL